MDGRRGNMATGMVIGGRAARACDVCGRERARWYCAADEAYLCERCDRSVHSANSVARRHERVRLGHNGAPVKIERKSSRASFKKDDSPSLFLSSKDAYHGSRKRPRTSRRYSCNSAAGSSPIKDVDVKAEPCSPIAEGQVPEFQIDDFFYPMEELGDVSHQVPIFAPPANQESSASDADSPVGEIAGYESSLPAPSASCCADSSNEEDELDFFIPENCIDINHFLESATSLSELDVDIDDIIGKENFSENPIQSTDDGLEMLDLSDSKELSETDYALECSDSRIPRADDGTEGDGEETCVGGKSPSRLPCSKVKTENSTMTENPALEADAILGFALDIVKSECGTQKLFLVLDYEDVLNAWSDRGSFWMDGRRPQTVPDDSCLDALVCMDANVLVPEMGFNGSSYGAQSEEQGGQVTGMVPDLSIKAVAREARVMRYREKRRTRLFSKKIRYEVRKLNAEKRPRMKGRFVKRAPGL